MKIYFDLFCGSVSDKDFALKAMKNLGYSKKAIALVIQSAYLKCGGENPNISEILVKRNLKYYAKPYNNTSTVINGTTVGNKYLAHSNIFENWIIQNFGYSKPTNGCVFNELKISAEFRVFFKQEFARLGLDYTNFLND
jgi:hypothetical protein